MIFFICFKMKSAENVFEFLNCQHENIKLTVEKQKKKKDQNIFANAFVKTLILTLHRLSVYLYRIYERMKNLIYIHTSKKIHYAK